MRLLTTDADGNFSLTHFVGNKIPPYGILSHTWEEDEEEVTFQDMKNALGVDKKGYGKIRFCGERARKDGLLYFWVDSCCIDKSSSAELSEAINSMFRWYQNATKCYAYLSDVSTGKHSRSSQCSWEQAFRRSRWFTRGWTLQELLAPRSVEFFSRDGKRLGDRDSLGKQVHEITGIPMVAFQGQLSQFSNNERMSWAENRKTTKEEDQAYCLMGIFNVYLPVLYGEGKYHALERLREAIDKRLRSRKVKTTDKECESLQLLRIPDLPAPPVQLSLERLEQEMEKLQAQLQAISAIAVNGRSPKAIVLAGSGLQMTLALGFLCEHLKKLVVHRSHRHHAVLDLVVNKLRCFLLEPSHLPTDELSHNVTAARNQQRRRPNQPIMVQWQLRGERPADCSSRRGLDRRLKQLSVTGEIEILIDLPIGKVRVCVAEESSQILTGESSFGTRVFFLPRPELIIGGIAASIIPGLTPMISSFAVQPCESPIFDHIHRRDLHGVQQAFSNGTASPTDRDEYGRSLLWYAVSFYDHEMIELLLREGADPFDCDSEGGNALICFVEQIWPRKQLENKHYPDLDMDSFLRTTRRLLYVCGADTPRFSRFVNDLGESVGRAPVNTLSVALMRVHSDCSDVLGAVDLLLNATLQEGVDIEQTNLFGMTPILSVTRNLEPHFYVPIMRKLLDRGVDPKKIDNNRRGILHHILYQLSACDDNGMKIATRRNLSSLIARLIKFHGCDPFLADDRELTPFDLALSPVAWGIWCDGLLSAGLNIEAELRREEAAFSTKDPEEITHLKFLEASYYIWQQSSPEDSRACRNQRSEICCCCRSGRDWEYRYQPFDLFGSYLTGETGDRRQHGYLDNHSDGTWCSNNVNSISCLDSGHSSLDGAYQFFAPPSAKELRWRKYVAFRLWRDGWLSPSLLG